jgi:hypothetical protein
MPPSISFDRQEYLSKLLTQMTNAHRIVECHNCSLIGLMLREDERVCTICCETVIELKL